MRHGAAWVLSIPAVDSSGRVLQWGHGREAVDGNLQALFGIGDLSFNGATAVRPWMGRAHC